MAEYTIEFNLSNVTIDDLVEFEEGDTSSVKFIRDFLGRFVSDGDDGVLDHDEGINQIGGLKLTDVNMLREKFKSEIDKVTDDAVDPTSEDDSETQ